MNQTLEQKLSALKLGRIREVYASWIEQAVHGELSYADFPYAATVEQFDFSLHPELKRTVLLRFFDSSFITTAGCLVLIGPSGLGKTHLAVALGTKMVQLGYRVRFVLAQQLVNAVLASTSRIELLRVIEPLMHCDLLILDEFGYLPMAPHVGPALYEILAGRYEKGATVITSNKSLATWGEVIGDSALMMAILDRLLHHGEVFYMRGSSYRLRGKEPVTLNTKGETHSTPEKP